jgi:MtN3 and saliva related transmembrane protein
MDFIPMLGTVAGVVSTLAFLPQVFKIWRTQSTKDISLGMYIPLSDDFVEFF